MCIRMMRICVWECVMVCVFVCMCVCACAFMNIHLYYIHFEFPSSPCLRAFAYMRVYVCVYVCMCVYCCVCVCAFVLACMCMCPYVHKQTFTHPATPSPCVRASEYIDKPGIQLKSHILYMRVESHDSLVWGMTHSYVT